MNLPLAITMGCPVGIGPELILKLFINRHHHKIIKPFVVIGDSKVLVRCARELAIDVVPSPWLPGNPLQPDNLAVFEPYPLDADQLVWGKPTLETGKAMARYIEEAVYGIQNQVFSAMVTCPISKSSLNKAGYKYPGHTEMLASLTGTSQYRMMMAGKKLRVVLVTIHEPLGQITQLLTQKEVEACIDMTMQSLIRDFALKQPRIGVAGLNPHAGEEGMFGLEEEERITPAVDNFPGPGQVIGPLPPDTVFYQAVQGKFDAVIAMYHDQGLIPFKLIHFEDGVNVTLGLPIVRTSVDHGTAYDIAGEGIASEYSLASALQMATEITTNRRAGRA